MVRLTDRPDMTLDVYRGRKTTKQQQQNWKWVLGNFQSLGVRLISMKDCACRRCGCFLCVYVCVEGVGVGGGRENFLSRIIPLFFLPTLI